ncbi:recombinase family protein [Heyndrickxia ginsengihumi]|uniref:recombinase family protein n=1 Tax=Heyndrickxia ginsengihumi TaxID=363870 RepID=UPI00203F28DB|nr:recombinase family protein [Heyndrickxia ginsengihumi]MCM3024186.1 recombinase family protein [Heyndrickxia ginsengihumi]
MKCAIYIRVSTDHDEQKTSLKHQRAQAVQYVNKNGWDVYEFYEDIQSGTTSKRKELQRLIRDANAKKFEVIITKEFSRLARNVSLAYQIKEIAQKNRIHIITLDGAVNTYENGNTGHMFGIYTSMYEMEAQNTSNRVKGYRRAVAHKGLFKGSIPPLGYKAIKGKLYVRDDFTPDLVKRIFKEYISGKGFDHIAKDLTLEGIPTPGQIAGRSNAGVNWQGSSIRKILENPHYTGDLVQGRSTTQDVTSKMRNYPDPKDYIIVKNTHEPIISREDFEAVQLLIANKRKKRPYQEKHLFTNTIFCADCGRGMHYRVNSKGYMCGNYVKLGPSKCSDHLVRENELKAAILEDIHSLIGTLQNEKVMKNLESRVKKQKQIEVKKLKDIEEEIEKYKKRKKRALDDYYDENTTKEEYNEYVDVTNKEIEALLVKKQELLSSLNTKDDTLAFTELKKRLEEYMDIKELTPDILHRLIERIEIKADGNARIHYRFLTPTAFS